MDKKWLIEELYSSEDCRHYILAGFHEDNCDKTGEKCSKNTCPLAIKKLDRIVKTK